MARANAESYFTFLFIHRLPGWEYCLPQVLYVLSFCDGLTFDSRWVGGPPSSVETSQQRAGLALRAIFIIFKRRSVDGNYDSLAKAVFLLQC